MMTRNKDLDLDCAGLLKLLGMLSGLCWFDGLKFFENFVKNNNNNNNNNNNHYQQQHHAWDL